MYLIFKNNQKILIQNNSFLAEIICITYNEEEALRVTNLFTKNNIQIIKFVDENDNIYEQYQHCVLKDQPYRQIEKDDEEQPTGRILVIAHLRLMTNIEKQIQALQESQDTQDLAIDDLAAAVSSIVEGE